MNKIYALVWSESRRAWVVAGESARRHGKSKYGARMAAAGMAWLGMSVGGGVWALPVGENITHGQADIAREGGQMVITQHTDKLITDWRSFDISAGNGVRFDQPGKESVALNKVTNLGATLIQGKLDANGRVFLINPAGIVFSQGAEVNVGGLVASTQTMLDTDFISGNYVFSDDSPSAVSNFGTITAHEGGGVALLGAGVNNAGVIQAERGTIALGGGEAFTLTFAGNKLLSLQIDRATLGAWVNNGNLLKADGGQVLLKASAVGSALNTVINTNGIIEANTLNGLAGRITLDGGTQGVVSVAGDLSATALTDNGDAGTIDTRGAVVQIKPTARVDTRASTGQGGIWNIATKAANVGLPGSDSSSQTISNVTLAQILGTTAISLSATEGDLAVNAPITWSNTRSLALQARQRVLINSTVRGTGNDAQLTLGADDRVLINRPLALTGDRSHFALNSSNRHEIANGASVTLAGKDAAFTANGQRYAVIQNLAQLRAIDRDLDGNYVLGNSIRGTSDFQSIGGSQGVFTGAFDGLGHTLDTFSVSGKGFNVGLFAASSGSIRNLALKSVTVTAHHDAPPSASLGSLVGRNQGEVYNVKSWSATVRGASNRDHVLGGLVGTNEGGVIERAAVSGSVDTKSYTRAAGGIVGLNQGQVRAPAIIAHSSSAATVSGEMQRNASSGMGGLVGVNKYGEIVQSSATGKTTVHTDGVDVGGLAGVSDLSLIKGSRASGVVEGGKHGNTGGLVGSVAGGAIVDSVASNTVHAFGAGNTGGAVGMNSSEGILFNVAAVGQVSDWEGQNVGGLVGANVGSLSLIDSSYARGQVDARSSPSNAYVGGLVGYNNGIVQDTESHTNVNAGRGAHVGGFVGHNDGSLQRVAAHGSVRAARYSFVGGLAGSNAGAIKTAVALGHVWGGYQSRIGGIVGLNRYSGEILDTRSRSSLDGGARTTLGGLAGWNQGLIDGGTFQGVFQDHWYTWMLGQVRGAETGHNTGIIR